MPRTMERRATDPWPEHPSDKKRPETRVRLHTDRREYPAGAMPPGRAERLPRLALAAGPNWNVTDAPPQCSRERCGCRSAFASVATHRPDMQGGIGNDALLQDTE